MDLNMDLEQSVYQYYQLGEYLLNQVSKSSDLNLLDTIAFPSWAMSWNMDYAVPELYWKNKFNLGASLLDMRDCGSLCVFNAISLFLKLYQVNAIKKFLCCSVENKFLLPATSKNVYAPVINYLGALSFSDITSNNSIQVLYCQTYKKSQIKTENGFLEILCSILTLHCISKKSCAFYLRKKNTIFPDSSGFIYFCINFLLKAQNKFYFKYAVIVDFDFSIGSTAVLLLKMG